MTSPLAPGSQEPEHEDSPRVSPATDDQADALAEEQLREQPFDAVAHFSDPKLLRPIRDAPQG